MGMKNLDKTVDMAQIRAQVDEALKKNNSEDISAALVRMAEGIQDNILKEAQTQARALVKALFSITCS